MPLSRAQLLFSSCLAFIAGIFFGNFFSWPAFWLFCLDLVLLFLVAILYFSFLTKKKGGLAFIVLFLSVFFVFGWWRYVSSLPDYSQPSKLSGYASSSVELIGRIARIDKTIDSQKLTVKTSYLVRAVPEFSGASEIKNQAVTGRVAVKTGLYPEDIERSANIFSRKTI